MNASLIKERIDLFFPFDNERDKQKEVILNIVYSFLENKSSYIIEAPTGFGKSVVSYTSAKVINSLIKDKIREMYRHYEEKELKEELDSVRTIILTKTRSLQDQYSESFDSLPSLWSARNYECEKYIGTKQSDTYYGSSNCDKRSCRVYKSCEYVNAKEKFEKSDQGVLNYDYHLLNKDFFPTVLVVDECHSVETKLCDNANIILEIDRLALSVRKLIDLSRAINHSNDILLESLSFSLYKPIFVGMKFSIEKSDPINYQYLCKTLLKLFLQRTMFIYGSLISTYEEFLWSAPETREKIFGSLNNQITDCLIDFQYYTEMKDKIVNFLDSELEWVFEDEENLSFKPIEASEELDKLLKGATFSIFTSATICGIENYAKDLRIENYGSTSVESTFPIENRKVYSVGLPGINYKNKLELAPVYVSTLDSIIENYPDNRGIIHTSSYENAKTILSTSSHSYKMVIPETDEIMELTSILSEDEDVIILSPAILEGIDLLDDLARFQIFFKVPYASLGNEWINQKRKKYKDWYARDAIIKVVQGSGRGVRSETDWCHTYILDGNFDRLLNNNNLFPVWFTEAVERLK